MIILSEYCENLPTINLVIQNIGGGPTNITFDFLSPVGASDGYMLSDLAFFQEELISRVPGARIVCY